VARISSVDRRTDIVQAALRVIARDGVSGATTRAIMSEAHMSLASFHYAFASRDEMMHELIAHVVENQTVAAFETITFGSDLRATIRSAFEAFFETISNGSGDEQVLFELMIYSMRTPRLASLPTTQWGNYRAAAIELLDAVAANAGIHWSVPTEKLAHMVVAMTDGLTLSWLATRDRASAAIVMDLAADSLAALAVTSSASQRPAIPASTRSRAT
jgi:AcrR family transcriptional regulator